MRQFLEFSHLQQQEPGIFSLVWQQLIHFKVFCVISKVWDFCSCKLALREKHFALKNLFLSHLNTGRGMVLESFLWLLLCSVLVSANSIFQPTSVDVKMWREKRTLYSTHS